MVGLRPVSLLAARKPGGDTPPPGALCRGGGGPAAGCGRLGVGLAAWPAPVPRLRLIRPPPGGAPPSPGRRGGGGPLSGARPWFSLGWPRAAASPGFLRRPGAEKGGGIIPAALESACPGRQRNGAPPAGCGPPPPHEGGWGLDSAACGRRGTSTGRKGVCGKPGKGVLHDDDPHFSELLEALKNASAWRKDFSPRKKGIPAAFAAGIPFFDEIPVKHNSITVRLSHPYTAERRPPWPSSLGQASRCWRSLGSRG